MPWVFCGYRQYKFYYVDSENVYDTYGNHVAGTFMLDRTSSSYAQWTSNNNSISWEGSLIRQNCLPANSTYYTYDDSVNSSTEGTYYIWDNTSSTWQSKILPSEYQDNIKYFSQNVSIEDGVFWTGLPENIRQNIVQVNNSTWTGYGGPVTNSSTANSNNDIIISQDFLWIPSDGQIFGNSDRYSNAANSKYTLEGKQLSAFTTYHENRFYSGNSRWLRSPYTASSSNFKYWNFYGYSSYDSASTSFCVGLCFCL